MFTALQAHLSNLGHERRSPIVLYFGNEDGLVLLFAITAILMALIGDRIY